MKKYILLVLLGASSYGMLASFAKIAYGQGYIAAEITFAQAGIGAMILWMPAIYSRVKIGNLQECINWKILLGGMGMGASAYTYYLSVQYIPASLAIVLLMQMTWISLFVEWLIYKRKPSKVESVVTIFILISTVLAGDLINISNFQFSLVGIGYAL
jgi:drug/metabolite transporter (DMT)-like permease